MYSLFESNSCPPFSLLHEHSISTPPHGCWCPEMILAWCSDSVSESESWDVKILWLRTLLRGGLACAQIPARCTNLEILACKKADTHPAQQMKPSQKHFYGWLAGWGEGGGGIKATCYNSPEFSHLWLLRVRVWWTWGATASESHL